MPFRLGWKFFPIWSRRSVEERTQILERKRVVVKSVVVIQSCVRSFMVRSRLKNVFRADFDREEKIEYSFDNMVMQIKRFNFFFNPRIDTERLHSTATLILSKSDSIVPKLHFDIGMQVRIRKIILMCLKLSNIESSREDVLLRLVNILTDVSSDQVSGIQWGISCWLHMVEKAEFFRKWRYFMERKIPPIEDPNIVPCTRLTLLCVSILRKPFAALQGIRNLIGVSPFGGESLNVLTVYNRMLDKFTTSFCTNVIPASINSLMVSSVAFPAISSIFPWQKWITSLNSMLKSRNFTSEEMKNILFSVLSLFNRSTSPPESPEFDMCEFFDCLKILLTSIDDRLAPPRPYLTSAMSFYIEEKNKMKKKKQKKRKKKRSLYEEYQEDLVILLVILRDSLNSFGVSQWMEPFNSQRWSTLCPVLSCIIRLGPKTSFDHFHCLPQLACNRDFIRCLYLEMISGGQRTNEEISTFCLLFCHLIETLHDAEFIDGIPLLKSEIPSMVNYMKNLYTTSVIDDRFSQDAMRMHTNKSIVAVLKAFHDRNTRMEMVPEEQFHSSISLILPINTHYIRFFENLASPETHLDSLETKLRRVLREFPYSLSFQDRVSVWNRMINIEKAEHVRSVGFAADNIKIRRKFIYEDAFKKLSPERVENLAALQGIRFVNVEGALEAGVDGGGLLREFLIEATRAAVDPNRGLFRVDSQNRIYPNPVAKKMFRNYLKHFYMMGRLVGKALYEQTHLELPFAAVFIEKFLTGNVKSTVDFLAILDPPLHKNLLYLKEFSGDWNSMSIDFTLTMEELGKTRVVELKKNGRDILVDSTNVSEYIHLVADFKINREIEDECRHFRAGIFNVVPLLPIFSWRDMQTLISGSDKPIDLQDWAANINYTGGFTPEHPTIVLFWQVLGSFEEKDLRKLLKFVTSCSRPPLLGFKDLVPKFGIQNAGVTDRLPTASTCMNLLNLPELNTADDLREKLSYVIAAEAGFDLA